MKTDELDHVARRIEESYANILENSYSKIEFHRNYQRMLVTLASDFGYDGRSEFEVLRLSDDRSGFIDVVWLSGTKVVLAIEIDSASRQKSLTKLGMVPDCERLWIYYGRRSDAELRARLDFPTRSRLISLPFTNRHTFT